MIQYADVGCIAISKGTRVWEALASTIPHAPSDQPISADLVKANVFNISGEWKKFMPFKHYHLRDPEMIHVVQNANNPLTGQFTLHHNERFGCGQGGSSRNITQYGFFGPDEKTPRRALVPHASSSLIIPATNFVFRSDIRYSDGTSWGLSLTGREVHRFQDVSQQQRTLRIMFFVRDYFGLFTIPLLRFVSPTGSYAHSFLDLICQ
jgi:hypothetical protein